MTGYMLIRYRYLCFELSIPPIFAVFVAMNVRLAALYEENLARRNKIPTDFRRHPLQSYKDSNIAMKVYIVLAVTYFIQVAVTLVLFFCNRKFNPATGIYGIDNGFSPATCMQGAEWCVLPSTQLRTID